MSGVKLNDLSVRRLILVIAALAALAALVTLAAPAVARADGDPGSDELVYSKLFFGATDGITNAEQAQLGDLLYATQALHAPVRVAIIGQQDDLGSITGAWGHPAYYSWYLGTELELAYSGRLVVVMPNGVAYFWHGHTTAHESGEALTGIASGTSASELTAAAVAGVTKVEQMAGISAAKLEASAHSESVEKAALAVASTSASGAVASTAPAAGTEPKASASARDVSPVVIVVGLLVVLGAVFWAPPLWRRRELLKRGGIAVPGLAVGAAALGALVVLAVVIHSSNSDNGAQADPLATNADLAEITTLSGHSAPDISLTDEAGQPMSLKQYRGKVVILSFTDDECQTICPLTTQALVDARDSLPASARKDVQLLSVNANPKSISVPDVANYTVLHGMVGQWHFLTGSDAQLEKVWREYDVFDDISTETDLIDHTPGLYIIDQQGRERAFSETYPSYASIPQFGQEIAQEVSRILPSHPKVRTNYAYSEIKGIAPSTRTTLPKVGGGTVMLGTQKHVYLFFATWDQESTALKGELKEMNAYEREAKRRGLPTLVAIDEGAVEPNRQAVTKFLAGTHLDYPVAVDQTGQVGDGYGVQGEPWFVLTVPDARNTPGDQTATTPWYQEVYTEGWPTVAQMVKSIPAALKPPTSAQDAKQVARELAGSSPQLQLIHRHASQLLSSGAKGLTLELKALKAEHIPVVVNVWASDCIPCQSEADYFATESAKYGSKVAFLGVDYEDTSSLDAKSFLTRHHVYYPSFEISDGEIPSALLPSGIESTPTTIFFTAKGQRAYVQTGSVDSQQQLDEDIQSYVIARSG